MLKKLILLFIILFNFFINIEVFADSIAVEKVFSDINSDYKYLKELQALYDKWMIIPDSQWKFNPYQLLTRDEFVWISMEVSCKKCIKPDVDYSFIQKYKTKPFYDVELINKNFYCIADAANNNYINWYSLSYTCNNWTYLEWQKPFCTNNNIILEEALAIILRVSWILTNEEAQKIRDDIYNWVITKNLSDDVSAKNIDWSVYSFYPDFKKALEYEVVEYDENWKKSIYHLVDIINGKLRPKKNITKEEFLNIAFVALKANNCFKKIDNNLWLQINIFDSDCNKNLTNCKLSKLNNGNLYDFWADVSTTCNLWIKEPEWYIWRYYNEATWEEYIKYWKYIDNYIFTKWWKWKIYLRVIDNCWNSSETNNSINIAIVNLINPNLIDNSLVVSIKANPIYWIIPLKINLEWVVIWNNWPFSYEWDFWDWTKWIWKNQEVIYKNNWIYEVILKVIDKDWNISLANIFINVNNIKDLNILNNNLDSDWDWISDLSDNCPLIKWKLENGGCPIFSSTCSSNNDCKKGYYCVINKNNYWICEIINLSNNINSLCGYTWGSLISWNIVCETCPCNNFIDFISILRKCDIIFPAITSPDNTIIYSKGDYYQIK